MADLIRNVIEMKNIAHMDLFRISEFNMPEFDFDKIIKEPEYSRIEQTPLDWKFHNWGCNNNAYCTDIESHDRISFYSPWSPPILVFRKLCEMFPDADISCRYASEEIGTVAGYVEQTGGEVTEYRYDDCSMEAFETYIDAWDDTDCLYKDYYGMWHRKSCDICGKCDSWREGEYK